MLTPMKARAPDGSEIRCEGSIAFGNAFLCTGQSAAEGQPPITIDRRVWITADARIDGRAELIRRMRSAGIQVNNDAPHAELILHAYRAFGDSFLTYLIGDFAFALWDADQEKLICARDHFGVRPFYYFESGNTFGFASTLDALLLHPRISRQLDELSVADLLLFGADQDAHRTIYRDIRRLPPGCRIDVTRTSVRVKAYWELPRQSETRYATRPEYVSRFNALFEQAVADRMPQGPTGLQLSGGLDSTAIAAVASSQPKARGLGLTSYTLCTRSIVPEDEEAQFAEIAAAFLDIPYYRQDLGAYELFERSASPALRTAAPLLYPYLSAHHDALTRLSEAGVRVLLSGHGADALMAGSSTYYGDLLQTGRILKLAREALHHLRHARSLAGMGLRSVLWPGRKPSPWTPPMPDWLDTGFATRVDLPARWSRGWQSINGGVDGYSQLTQTWLSRNFEAVEILNLPIVARYPFYDVRLVEFLLGLPNFMLARKLVLREAMRDRLPESIRSRPKTVLAGDAVRQIVTNDRLWNAGDRILGAWPTEVNQERFMAALSRYRQGEGSETTWASALMLAPVVFGIWLSQSTRSE